MTQYKSIYIPTREMVFGELLELDGCGLEEIEGPLICMTIEELKEMWNHCANCQVDKETEYANSINFTTYLQSKGINTTGYEK